LLLQPVISSVFVVADILQVRTGSENCDVHEEQLVVALILI